MLPYGYPLGSCWIGLVPDQGMIQFETEDAYIEYLRDNGYYL